MKNCCQVGDLGKWVKNDFNEGEDFMEKSWLLETNLAQTFYCMKNIPLIFSANRLVSMYFHSKK